MTDTANAWIIKTLGWVSKPFGWYYLLAATLYIVFRYFSLLHLAFGNIKLGPEQSKPEFSVLSWSAMLFAAGIGIDLMFFSVAEPILPNICYRLLAKVKQQKQPVSRWWVDIIPLWPDGLVYVCTDWYCTRVF